jgi:hypothetical protein
MAADLSLQGFGGGAGYFQPVNSAKADYIVSTAPQLASALSAAHSGQIVYVADNAVIDVSNYSFLIPQGVTLASGRGQNASPGALLFVDYNKVHSNLHDGVIRTGGVNVRVTGLRIKGPHPDVGREAYDNWYSRGIVASHTNLEVDNCEIWAWSHAGIYLIEGASGARIHHDSIHACQRAGLGYGVCLDAGSTIPIDPLIQYSSFDSNRHSIAGTGVGTESYEASYNVVGALTTSHCFDMHGGSDREDGTDIAGDNINIHHNLFKSPSYEYAICIRGQPVGVTNVHDNWFIKHADISTAFKSVETRPRRTTVQNNVFNTSPAYNGNPPRNPPIGHVVSPGFEGATVRSGLPLDEGIWSWDGDAAVVGTQNGVAPRSGSKMLRISGAGGTVYQTVDVTGLRQQIEAGLKKGTLFFYVNRVQGDSQSGQFQAIVWTMNGFPSYFSTESLDPAVSPYSVGPATSNPNNLGRFLGPSLLSDNNPATWQRVSVDFAIPAGTDYLAIGLLATGLSQGCYFDDVSLMLAPEPPPGSMPLRAGLRASWRRARQRSPRAAIIPCRKTITE